MKRAMVVFSGGQDSTTALAWALDRFDKVEAVTFDYGQRNACEIECARSICTMLGVKQHVVKFDALAGLGGNAMTDSSKDVSVTGGLDGLPSTFVPGRNILFLTMAAALATTRGIENIVTGIAQAEPLGYPDCTDETVRSIERTYRLGTETEMTIHSPLMWLTKAQIWRMAERLGALELVRVESHTCYLGDRSRLRCWGYGCGKCFACLSRAYGWFRFRLTSMVNSLLVKVR